MEAPLNDGIAVYGYAMAALAYGGLVVYLLLSGRLIGLDRRSGGTLLAALGATAIWSGAQLLSELWPTRALEPWAALLDLLRYGLWFVFLQSLFRTADGAVPPLAVRVLRGVSLLSLGAGAAMLLANLDGSYRSLSAPQIAASLMLPVCGLLVVEQLFRNLGEDSRWNAKPVCLALGCVYVFDIYLFSEALLFGRFDEDAFNMRGAAHALAVPLLLSLIHI